jgi:hypothetical protein
MMPKETAEAVVEKAAPRALSVRAFMALPGTKPIAITDLSDARCRWPIDAEAHASVLYCGLPVTGHRYCAAHSKLSSAPPRRGG